MKVKIRFLTFGLTRHSPELICEPLKAGSEGSAALGPAPSLWERLHWQYPASKQIFNLLFVLTIPNLEKSGTYLSIASRQEQVLKVLNSILLKQTRQPRKSSGQGFASPLSHTLKITIL